MAFGQAAGDACRDGFGECLEFGEGFEAELVDINGYGNRREIHDGSVLGIGIRNIGGVGQGHEMGLGETADLSLQNHGRTLVPKHHIRASDFLVGGQLCRENGFDHGFVETAACLESLDLGGPRGGDDDHLLLAEIEAFFKEQRDVSDEKRRATVCGLAEGIKTFLQDAGMNDGFELAAGRIVGKYPPSKEVPVHSALPVERLGTEGGGHHRDDVRIHLEHAAYRRIAIENDHRGQALAKQAANRGFS